MRQRHNYSKALTVTTNMLQNGRAHNLKRKNVMEKKVDFYKCRFNCRYLKNNFYTYSNILMANLQPRLMYTNK